MRGREPRGVQHRAVAADRDHQVRFGRELRGRPALDAGRAEVDGAVALGEHLAPAGVQVHREDLHRLDDARVAIVADEGDAREQQQGLPAWWRLLARRFQHEAGSCSGEIAENLAKCSSMPWV